MKRILPAIALLVSGVAASAQTVTVKDTVYTTYGFSDPNPVPLTSGNVYPYHKYETFDFEPGQKTWKTVILENDWIRVRIMPEIGGKIWSVYDKTTGKEMFYDNDVVKFREISLRGPWTSGGIEFNYGIIGHAPSCAHPVEYRTETKEDGSVSCYIGVLELLTRTSWTVEINLPKDAVWLRTRSFWHNRSGNWQPYYTWANSGVRASDDLELIYPSTYTIGHDGVTSPYPVDEEGHDLSLYANQNFGIDKSFHPGGSHKGFFGAWWKDDGFGMLHYALRDEKLGRKYFSWAQSPQGDIWKGLLTDGSPQYVELQSGRLFNQNLLNSIGTPFKQTLFTPYGTDGWNEYWMPVAGIGGADEVSLQAVVKLSEDGGSTRVGIYPLTALSGRLVVEDASGNRIVDRDVDLGTAVPFFETLPAGCLPSKVYVGGRRIWSSDSQTIDRPHKINREFSLESAQGQAIYAKYLYGMRYFREAEDKVDRALELDPSLVPALTLKASLCLRKMEYGQAYDYAGRALAIDEYDPEANYAGGLAAEALGRKYDAMDRFEVAAITSELRSAAHQRLARLHFVDGQKELAAEYARKSLVGNACNVSAYELLYQAEPSEEHLAAIGRLDPLSPFPAMERMLAGEISAGELAETVKEELRWQVYLEYASFYSGLGLRDKASALIGACPEQNALLAAWSAWLKEDVSAVAAVDAASVDLVFPFRPESVQPLEWCVENGGGWKPVYMLAMLKDFLGHRDEAAAAVAGLSPDYAPFYAYRSSLTGSVEDLEKAVSLDPQQWRYRQSLALKHYAAGDYAGALKVVEPYYASHRDNFHIGDTYLKTLIALGQYRKADKVIAGMRILPFEGQSGSHVMWRDIKLHLAAECLDRGNAKAALQKISEALEWPENLGVGKPYDNLVDTSSEDLLSAVAYSRLGDRAKAEQHMSRVNDPDGSKAEFFRKATVKTGGKYAKLSPMLGNMDSSLDRKLF